MKVAVHQPNYIPWLGYFAKIAQADVFVFYDDVQFEKGGYTNRVRIQGQDGPRWLSQPVLKRGILSKTIKDVVFPEEEWSERHRSILYHEYRRSEHFHDLEPLLERLYSFRTSSLSEWNVAAIRLLCTEFAIGGKTLACSSAVQYDRSRSASEKLVAICRAFGADSYLSGSGGASYHDDSLFSDNGIRVEYSTFAKRNTSPVFSYSALHAISVLGIDSVRELLNAESGGTTGTPVQ